MNSSTIGYGCFDPAGAAIGVTARGMRLLSAIIFISIILMILVSQFYSVSERRNDLGILKAIGWSQRIIVSQVLFESFIQSSIGGLAGCLVAVLVYRVFPIGEWLGLEELLISPPNLTILIIGFFFTVLAGLMAGAASSILIVQMKPAHILRKL